MRPNTKPVHVWNGEVGFTLEVGVMPPRKRGLICCCWNDFDEKWEYGEFNGYLWDRIRNIDAVPGGFRAYLLLVGLT